MATINVRNIEDLTYRKIKDESKKKGVSINKLLLNILNKYFKKDKVIEFHDLDEFFGSWSDKEYKEISDALKETRRIDRELWK